MYISPFVIELIVGAADLACLRKMLYVSKNFHKLARATCLRFDPKLIASDQQIYDIIKSACRHHDVELVATLLDKFYPQSTGTSNVTCVTYMFRNCLCAISNFEILNVFITYFKRVHPIEFEYTSDSGYQWIIRKLCISGKLGLIKAFYDKYPETLALKIGHTGSLEPSPGRMVEYLFDICCIANQIHVVNWFVETFRRGSTKSFYKDILRIAYSDKLCRGRFLRIIEWMYSNIEGFDERMLPHDACWMIVSACLNGHADHAERIRRLFNVDAGSIQEGSFDGVMRTCVKNGNKDELKWLLVDFGLCDRFLTMLFEDDLTCEHRYDDYSPAGRW